MCASSTSPCACVALTVDSSFVDADVQDRYSEALLNVLIDNVCYIG